MCKTTTRKKSSFSTVMTKKVISFFSLTQISHVLMFMLVMARYSHKGHDSIRYDITQNIAIRYDTIRSESASPYVRTASKQATAHNTGAPSFCLSTLSPLQVPGYWPTVMGDRRGDRRRAGSRCSLKSRVIQQGFCTRIMYQVVGFGWDDGRHSEGRRRSVV